MNKPPSNRGVMRQAVLQQCVALGLEVREADLRPTDLAEASEIFMTNALVGIQSVSRFDGVTYSAREVAKRLRDALGAARDD